MAPSTRTYVGLDLGANERTYVGLDLGTTKVVCIIAVQNANGELHVVGVGNAPNNLLPSGHVGDSDETVASIAQSVAEAERMAGIKVMSVCASIAGGHVRSFTSRGVIDLAKRMPYDRATGKILDVRRTSSRVAGDGSAAGNEIAYVDVERVIEAAKAIDIPFGHEIIRAIPQEFIVDEKSGIKNPVGMSGLRLAADVHIITGATTDTRSICRAIERVGLRAHNLVPEPLASAAAVLDTNERDLGVVLLDIGGRTTSVAMFYGSTIRHSEILPFGGANVTSDLAYGLRASIDEAEAIKIQHGSALASLLSDERMISVSSMDGSASREISRHVLASIIEPRMEEILALAYSEVRKSRFAEMLTRGVVLTGGTSLLHGAAELAERFFKMPVRLGVPRGLGGLSAQMADPRFSTGIGLVLQAARPDAGQARRLDSGREQVWGGFDREHEPIGGLGEDILEQDQVSSSPSAEFAPPEPSTSDDGYIFVSYKREDLPRIVSFMHRITSWGYPIWYDQGIPGGAEWDALIEEKVCHCKIFLVFLSNAAVESKWVRREIKLADSENRPILGIRLDRDVVLRHGLKITMRQYQMIDASAANFSGELRKAIEYTRLL